MKYVKHSTVVDISKVRANGYASVILRVSSLGKRDSLHTGINIPLSAWSTRTHKVKNGSLVDGTPFNILNETIDEQVQFVNDYYNDCAMRNADPTLSELKDKFNHAFKSSVEKGSDEFFYLFDKFIEEMKDTNAWQADMVKAVKKLRDHVKDFKPDITFADLSTKTMNAFKRHLSKSMYNDTLIKRLSYLKTFINWAAMKGYKVHPEYASYNPKLPTAKKEVRYLTLAELKKIQDCEIEPGSALDRTRDFFLFQCHTALRYSDIRQLTHDNIVVREDGSLEVKKLTEKDDDYIRFKLSKTAVNIYNKYKDNAYPGNVIFPILSNQKYNDHLKDLGKAAKLEGEWTDYEYRLDAKEVKKSPKADLESHTARRTFIVVALNEGISTDLIALITSHSDVKAMKPYIALNSKGTDKVIDALDHATTKDDSKKQK